MYGVPKFKESIFMKYRKEVLLTAGAFLTIAIVVNVAPKQSIDQVSVEANAIVREVEIEKPVIGYQMVYNGVDLGIIEDTDIVDDLIEQAYNRLVINLGYDPEMDIKPNLTPVKEGEIIVDTASIVDQLTTELFANLDVVKTKAFVMRIGDEFTVALKNEDDVKAVLEAAQMHFIHEDVSLEVNLDVNEHNSMVMTPKVLMKEPTEDVALSTASATTGEVPPVVEDEALEDSEEEAVEELEGTMVAIQFAEDIAIVEAYVDPGELVDIGTAIELITKENEEEKIYLVQSGDCPSIIAENNDMKLSDLYKMNPGLEDQKVIHLDDPIVVMVPEPELKVETKVEVVYNEPIFRQTVYVDDPEMYVSSTKTLENGSDGSLEVTAIITKLNGEETGREVIKTVELVSAKNMVIAKGSMPFPVKGATGEYIFPVSGYRISSLYGYRWGSFHHGVDLAVGWGTAIHAADGGTVTFAGWKSSTYGYFVEIDHGDGVTTRYAHCSSISAEVGQQVAKGEEIAKVGSTGRSTGPHVHFEIRFDGVATDPLDYLE